MRSEKDTSFAREQIGVDMARFLGAGDASRRQTFCASHVLPAKTVPARTRAHGRAQRFAAFHEINGL
jgi:hypothetical protein